MRRSLILLPLLATACVPAARPPAVATAPRRSVAATAPVIAAPPLAADWRDWPVTPGGWSYARDARGAVASFGEAGAVPALTLRCDAADRRMVLSRNGTPATPLTLRASSVARVVPVRPAGGAATAALAPTDPLLDALAFSRGRFVVEQAGRPPLVAPSHPEIGRVIEDCRG